MTRCSYSGKKSQTIEHQSPHMGFGGPEGPKSKLSKTTMLALAVTIHNFPEGMAVGVAIAGALSGGAIS